MDLDYRTKLLALLRRRQGEVSRIVDVSNFKN